MPTETDELIAEIIQKVNEHRATGKLFCVPVVAGCVGQLICRVVPLRLVREVSYPEYVANAPAECPPHSKLYYKQEHAKLYEAVIELPAETGSTFTDGSQIEF